MSLRSAALPLLVLTVSLAGTAVVWYGLNAQVEANAADAFESDARQIAETISARMRAYEDALQSVVALFAATDTVSRDDWRRFVDRLELRRDYPGIEVLGFAKRVCGEFGFRRRSAADTTRGSEAATDSLGS